MSKAPSPLLGYNNNVRHKSRVFHIQTEDSGVKHPHIITHLFMDGGRILKSVKKGYSEHLGTEGLADVVRTMMKEQHKAMFIALRGGHFDHLVEAASDGPASRAPTAVKINSDAPSAPPISMPASAPPSGVSAVSGVSAGETVAAKVSDVAAPPSAASAPPMSGLETREAPRSEEPPVASDDPLREKPVVAGDAPSSQPETVRAAGESVASGQRDTPTESTELTLDIDALEPAGGEPVAASEPPAPAVRDPYWRSSQMEARVDAAQMESFDRPAPAESAPAATSSSEALRDLSPALFKKRADTFRFRHLPGKETRATAALLSTSIPNPPPRPPSPLPASLGIETRSPHAPPLPASRPLPASPSFVKADVRDVPPSSAEPSRVPDTDKSNGPPSSQRGGKAVLPPSAPLRKSVAASGEPPASEGRYAPARPAAIFGHARPLQGSSIFGEDLISDKSLDEVILSYLAEDLETDKK